MPPLKAGRASKACDLCRKHKTRCYASENAGGCLRCETLALRCSLGTSRPSPQSPRRAPRRTDRADRLNEGSQNDSPNTDQNSTAVNERLERLERSVQGLCDRLDSRLDDLPPPPKRQSLARLASNRVRKRSNIPSRAPVSNPAPVLLIRDAAVDAGVESPGPNGSHQATQPDVITSGIITLSTALTLLELFCEHYGRWVHFPDQVSPNILLAQVRVSPLLLSSVCLIAVRYTTKELADKLAPKLFHEVKIILQSSLLVAPQPIQFFQAVLILSLWSTTIGQTPLSVDSWLLTGYALQQALANPEFITVLQAGTEAGGERPQLDVWCIWNHLCIAHLQYCVGTRRYSLLNEAQIQSCIALVEHHDVDNFESRMAAEIELYWIIYRKCSASEVDLSETEQALDSWNQEWCALFDQPRSQFIQMGYHFAYLLAYYQSLRSTREIMEASVLTDMIQRCQRIIDLAMGTADEHTPHVSDHIYHIMAFSALTLCRLAHTYEAQLQTEGYDVAELDGYVVKLVNWLRSIGLQCHIGPLLGRIVHAQFKKLRPDFNPQEPVVSPTDTMGNELPISFAEFPNMSTNAAFMYPDIIGSELFNLDNTLAWPQWG